MFVIKVFLAVLLMAIVIRILLNSLKWYRFMRLALQTEGPSPWFILRNCLRFTYHTQAIVNEICRSYNNKPFRIFTFSEAAFVFSDPADISDIIKNKHLSDKPRFLYGTLDSYFRKTILTGNGDFWSRCRRALEPAFHVQALRSYIPAFNKGAQDFVEEMRPHSNGEDFKIYTLSLKTVPATNLQLVFSQKLDAQTLRLLYSTMKRCLYFTHVHDMNSAFFHIYHRAESTYRAFLKNVSTLVNEHCQNIIKKKEEFTNLICSTEVTAIHPCRVIEHVLFKYGNSEVKLPLTNDELAAQMILVGLSSFETSLGTFTLALTMLALHPEVQQKVREEMLSIFGDSDRPAEFEDLKHMEQLERVIKEVLRLYPPIPTIARVAKKDVEINGTKVPKGGIVAINLMALQRNARIFKNPDQFDPDRFLPENVDDIPPFGYIPFSTGIRKCIGIRFAMIQLKVLASTVIRNFELHPGEGFTFDDVQVESFITARIVKPIMLRAVPLKR